MAELSLRAYVEYIEDRLARDASAEAVAQCRHILTIYPKHIDTYRLLAKATAAQENFMDALDLFQRVLSADPGDFVAHVGMSECYKEDGALDQAIWHLERAFEQVPSNRDLQNEIKKLYEQRDGHAPLKVQMTAGALARMYVKGKLYDQAIAELTKALSADPERLDLQVLVSEALWNSHQEVAAAKVAAEVLKKLPYSIDANRILAQLWLKAGQPAEARPFIDRVKELDPYASYQVEHNGETAPAESFRLHTLEFTADVHASQVVAADWVTEIKGIEKQQGVSGPLKSEGGSITDIFAAAPPPAAPTPPSPAAAPTPMGGPDWLRSALGTGKLKASEAKPEWLKDALGGTGETPAAPAAPAAGENAPEWLKDVIQEAPPPTPSEIRSAPPSTESAPDWLKDAVAGTPPPVSPAAPDSAPDWLNDTLEPGTPSVPLPAAPAAPPPAAGGKEAPAWLSDVLNEQTPASVQMPVGDNRPKPSWLEDVLADTPVSPPPTTGSKTMSTDMLTNLIRGGPLPAGEPPPPTTPFPAEEKSPVSLDDQGELEPWDGAPMPVSPPVSSPPEDWLTQDTGLKRAEKEQPQEEESKLPDWLMSDAPVMAKKEEKPEAVEAAKDELPSWLTGAPDKAKPAEARAEPEQKPDEVPDWLKGETADTAGPVVTRPLPDEKSDELPDWMKGEPAESAGPVVTRPLPDEKSNELPDWMKSGPAESAGLAVTRPLPDEESDELPDWMKSGSAGTTGPAVTRSLTEEESDELPDSMKSEPADTGGPAVTKILPEEESGELPDSMKSDQPEARPSAEEPSQQPEEQPVAQPVAAPEAKASSAASPAPEEEKIVAPPDETPQDGSSAEDVPDWLSSGDLDSDDALKWIEEMAARIDPNFKAEGAGDETAKEEAAPVAEAPKAEEQKEEDELEWLRTPTETKAEEEKAEAEEELPDWLKTEPAEAEPVAKASVAPTDPDTQEALKWLDEQVKGQGISADQPVAESLTPDHPPVAAMPRVPDLDAEAALASDDDLPAWLKDAGVQEAKAKAMEAPDAAPDLADMPELPVEADELAWLNDALKAEEKSGAGSGDLEELFAEAGKAEAALSDQDQGELPAWLKGEEEVEKPAAAPVIEVKKEEAPAVEAPKADEKQEVAEELPAWLKGEEEEATAGQSGLTAFLQAVEPAPPAPQEKMAEPPKAEPAPPAPAPVASVAPTPAPAVPAPIPPGEAGDQLKAAREQMSNGELQNALVIYEALVASGHGFDETVSDLMEIVRTRAVVNPKVYRVLGDAMMGKGQMQEALEMYKKALDNF